MDELDIYIFDNYTEGMEHRIPYVNYRNYCYYDKIITLSCQSGSISINVRFKDYKLTKNSFLVILPGTPFYLIEDSPDVKLDILVVSKEALNVTVQGVVKLYFTKILSRRPLQAVPANVMDMYINILKYLKNFIDRKDNYFYAQIVKNYLSILFYESCNFMMKSTSNNENSKDIRKNELASNFISMVEKNVREHRNVGYYADKLNISAKYLSSVIKEATNRPPIEWIDDYTLFEAKRMLQNTTTPIQNIAYDLDFSTPSHFTMFFKSKTGFTPKEFRKGKADSSTTSHSQFFDTIYK